MTDEEELKRKVKQQKTLIVWLLIMVVGLTVVCLYQITDSRMKSQTYKILLQRMELQVERLEYDFQKRLEAVEIKKKDQQQDVAVEEIELQQD